MGSTSNHNLTTFDPTVDGAKKFKEYIEKDSKENMVIIDTELKNLQDQIDNKVTIDEVSQSNFNFNAREVVPDGLICDSLVGITHDTTTYETENFTFHALIKNVYQSSIVYNFSTSLFTGFNFYIRSGNNYALTTNDGTKFETTQTNCVAKVGDFITCIKNSFKFLLFVNGQLIIDKNVPNYKLSTTNKIMINQTYCIASRFIYYNHQLTPQEIAHNFQALNNSPSITSLNGYKFDTDSNHVTMDTGYSHEEYATARMLESARTFTSDGSPIEVNNGSDKSKILMAMVEGQTLKNELFKTIGNRENDYWYSNTEVTRAVPSDVVNLKPSTKYTAIYDVIDNTLDKGFYLFASNPFNIIEAQVIINGNENKSGKLIFTTKADMSTLNRLFTVYTNGSTSGSVKYKVVIFEGDYSSQTFTSEQVKNIKLGLNSCVAIISNNGIKYPFG